MKRLNLIPAVAFLCSSFCMAQGAEEVAPEMRAHGKVTDAKTNKGIKASIRYSSIPTGSITGNFRDSTYVFEIFGTAKYRITAEAKGYNPRTVIVDPRDIGESHDLVRDIKLTPSGEAIRLDHLIFRQGKAIIEPDSYDELDEIAQMMQENEKIEIRLEGHTDSQGNAEGNMKLSQKRVEAVKEYLIKQGISKARVKTKAFGGTRPLGNEMTEEDRARNRRVEMRILKD